MSVSTPELTIVIALYNGRSTIEAALRSALVQPENVEVVVVDDCSTDGSPDIVRQFAQAHPRGDRVRLFLQHENGGAAAARNRGVGEAHGRFVSFLDSDDEYLPGFASTLLDAARRTGSQIAVGNVVHVRTGGHETERRPAVTGFFPGRRAARLGLLDRLSPFTCDKVIARELFDEVDFPEGLVNEDFLTNPVLAARAEQVAVVDVPVYRYQVRSESVTWTATTRAFELDRSIAYLEQSLLAGPGRDVDMERAIRSADVLLTLLTGQRALLHNPASPVVAECRKRLWRRGPRPALRLGPFTAAATAAFILVPRLYRPLYQRRVARLYGT